MQESFLVDFGEAWLNVALGRFSPVLIFPFLTQLSLEPPQMLELKNIHKSFGDVRVLNGASLRLEKGRCVK